HAHQQKHHDYRNTCDNPRELAYGCIPEADTDLAVYGWHRKRNKATARCAQGDRLSINLSRPSRKIEDIQFNGTGVVCSHRQIGSQGLIERLLYLSVRGKCLEVGPHKAGSPECLQECGVWVG